MLLFLINTAVIAVCFYVMTKVVDSLFIQSLDNIAQSLKLSPNVAGATLLAIGTSAPELSTTMFALFLANANPATGLGTVVGSAIFQILVVIGFASVVKTTYLNWKPVLRDGFFYLISVLQLILVVQDGVIVLTEGLSLLAVYLLYLVILIVWSSWVDEDNPDPIPTVEKTISKQHHWTRNALTLITGPIDAVVSLVPKPANNPSWTLPVFVLSLVTIAGASYFLVLAAESMALILGISPAIIALTVLAGGSSIPELISSRIIAKEGRGDMAISNAVGSNIFDILVSLGLPVTLFIVIKQKPAIVDAANITSSLFLLVATLVAVLSLLVSQKFKLSKQFGYLLIGGYVLYVIAAYAGFI